jgi:hypothetical protein
LKGLFAEFGRMQDKVNLLCDNQSAIPLAKNPTYHSKTKHIPIKYHFVRQVIDECGVSLEKLHTKRELRRHVHKTNTFREAMMVLGFSWLVEKVMNKRKEQGIRLIIVKVEIVEFGDNEFLQGWI